MLFSDLRLAEPVLRAISYPTPTPIQAKAIPHVLEGRDVLGCAQTDTGKTAAFPLPILHRPSPTPRQTLMFSATMPREIRTLADTLLKNPAVVEVTPVATPVEAIDQSVYFVNRNNKPELLARLVKDLPMFRAIVFTRTKHGADR